MSKAITLIFPHQLFDNHPAIEKDSAVWLVEDPLFFTQYPFHKKKLVLHRASMRAYWDVLKQKGLSVNYVDAHSPQSSTEQLVKALSDLGITEVHCAEISDYMMERRLRRYTERMNIRLVVDESPGFMVSSTELGEWFSGKKKFLLNDFYIHQRKHKNVMVDASLQPVGGKWSYDSENREKMPASVKVPAHFEAEKNKYVVEATSYVEQHFPNNPGSTNGFIYPIDRRSALHALELFCTERLALFGKYQDAIVRNEKFLFHSVLTPAMNVGLITPDEVISAALDHYHKNDLPINSVEGFVRQVLGWREFVRGVYKYIGVEERKRNYWGHRRPIPASFWNGTTGIIPVDNAIKKVLDDGYNHHIDRLMVLGNFMLLCEFDPDEVYRWFMSMYIDSYDWVMVPNVYGMSQFADGGMMSTKPYISGSNYVLKMSDHPKGPWTEVWDGLFWRFIHLHREFFLKNFRLSMMVRTLDKMQPAKREYLMQRAEKFLTDLDAGE